MSHILLPRILLPFDGSPSAARALRYVVQLTQMQAETEVHLVNVQPLANEWIVHRLLPEAELAAMAQEYGEAALAPALAELTAADIKTITHIERGEIAQTLARVATETHCTQIVMGTRGLSTLGDLLLGSVATKVLHLTPVPVTFVK